MGLFTPKWMTDLKETQKLTREKDLLTAALKGQNPEVRMAAVMKLTGRDALYRVVTESNAENPGTRNVILAALKQLNAAEYDGKLTIKALKEMPNFFNSLSPKELVGILRDCRKEDTIRSILSLLGDQTKLKDLFLVAEKARKSGRDRKWADDHIDKVAVSMIRNPEISMELLRTNNSSSLGKLYDNLSDAQLMEFIRGGRGYYDMIKRIKDRSLLEEIVQDPVVYSDDSIVNALAILKNPDKHRAVLESDQYSAEVKRRILYNSPLAQEDFIHVFRTSPDEGIQSAALTHIKDRDLLTQVLETAEDESLRQKVCGMLGHRKEFIRSWDEHARHGRGYRSHTEYRCTVCGKEFEEVDEHDN
ncbi:MAG: hypothetical protein IJH91_05640 [Mogibacterium sp.]|nr:hypothetical protein [Mogibacterium sp.]